MDSSDQITRRMKIVKGIGSLAKPSFSPVSPSPSFELSKDHKHLSTQFGIKDVFSFQTDRTDLGGGRMDTRYSINFMSYNIGRKK